MEEQNGSTEVWLGTHANTTIADQEGEHGDRASGRIKQDLLKKQKEVRGPCQPLVKKGSVIVRDLRLWHGGKPNLSDRPRVMLALSMSNLQRLRIHPADIIQYILLRGTVTK